MDPEVLSEAKDFVSTAIEKASGGAAGVDTMVSVLFDFKLTFQAACRFVKESMDRQFGPAWHCVMGEGFSFEVTRQAKSTLYMYYAGKIAVLLFKC